jgi:protein-S-isoprenylcysteine O-methyltransferase Ste14
MGMKPPLPPVWFWGACTVMVGLRLLVPLKRLVPWPWNLAGTGLIAVGVAVNLWTDRRFKQAGTTVKPFEPSTRLLTGGPFRLSRNPMYVGMTACLLGLAVLLGTALPFAVVPVFAVAMDRLFIVPEERAMVETFGGDYGAYRRRVRRWI